MEKWQKLDAVFVNDLVEKAGGWDKFDYEALKKTIENDYKHLTTPMWENRLNKTLREIGKKGKLITLEQLIKQGVIKRLGPSKETLKVDERILDTMRLVAKNKKRFETRTLIKSTQEKYASSFNKPEPKKKRVISAFEKLKKGGEIRPAPGGRADRYEYFQETQGELEEKEESVLNKEPLANLVEEIPVEHNISSYVEALRRKLEADANFMRVVIRETAKEVAQEVEERLVKGFHETNASLSALLGRQNIEDFQRGEQQKLSPSATIVRREEILSLLPKTNQQKGKRQNIVYEKPFLDGLCGLQKVDQGKIIKTFSTLVYNGPNSLKSEKLWNKLRHTPAGAFKTTVGELRFTWENKDGKLTAYDCGPRDTFYR